MTNTKTTESWSLAEIIVTILAFVGIACLIVAVIGATGFGDSTEEYDKNGCIVRIQKDRSWWETTDVTITKFCKENSK